MGVQKGPKNADVILEQLLNTIVGGKGSKRSKVGHPGLQWVNVG